MLSIFLIQIPNRLLLSINIHCKHSEFTLVIVKFLSVIILTVLEEWKTSGLPLAQALTREVHLLCVLYRTILIWKKGWITKRKIEYSMVSRCADERSVKKHNVTSDNVVCKQGQSWNVYMSREFAVCPLPCLDHPPWCRSSGQWPHLEQMLCSVSLH